MRVAFILGGFFSESAEVDKKALELNGRTVAVFNSGQMAVVYACEEGKCWEVLEP